jgi:hypothetical protein
MDPTARPRVARLALFGLGAWFALTAGMSYVAGANFMVLRVESLPRAVEAFGPTVEGSAGADALRYLAGEINRHLFAVYAWTQLAVALFTLVAVGLTGLRSRALNLCVGLSLGAALLFLVYLLPEIVEVSRRLDLVPKEPRTPDRDTFDGIHHAAVIVEVTKLALLGAAAFLLARGPKAGHAA